VTACNGFTRSEALRNGIATAGRGLPAIEPGMPTPAGTGLTRRSMLLRSAGLGLSVYGASRMGLGALQEGVAQAAVSPGQRVLVSIFLPGGLDSLSVLAPVGDPRYATLRSNLALSPGSGSAFSEDSRLMWAPAAAGLRTLHGEGKVTVLPAIGYTGADQSHFTSRHFWEVGETSTSGSLGWMGRFLDAHGTPDNPLQGLSLSDQLSPALAAARVPVAAVPHPDDFGLYGPGVWNNAIEQKMYAAIGDLGRAATNDPGLRTARAVAGQVDSIRRSLAPFERSDAGPAFTSPVAYPAGDFGERLSALSAMLAGGLPLRCVTLDAPGGYDTHSNQERTLARDLGATCDGVLAFQRDLEARGLADRVTTLLWSEFGRRPQENASGTDHGAAGVGFVVGSRVRGTQIGEFPGLATLDPHGNLRATSDFRAMYCSLLEQWLGVDAAQVIPGAASFARPALMQA